MKLFPTAAEAAYNEKLSAAMDEADQAFEKCFPLDAALETRLLDGGEPVVTVRLVVVDNAGTGRVHDAEVVDSDFLNPLIGQCLVSAASRQLFPAPPQSPFAMTILASPSPRAP